MFVGRQYELDQALRAVADNKQRTLTITGPGGVGKTHLALEVAHSYQHAMSAKVGWISAAPITNPLVLCELISSAVESFEREPTSGTGPQLLVVDNLEQLAQPAATVLSSLEFSSRLHILITSRASLRIEEEYVLELAPFAVGAENLATSKDRIDALRNNPAIQLFAYHAHNVGTTFNLDSTNIEDVTAICSRVDGLPLGIELAAARTRHLTIAEIRQRLDQRLPLLVDGRRDAPARHQTLRAAIDWSYQLLSEEEKAVFCELSIFAGSFDLRAAEAITQRGMRTLDVIAVLLDHHLLFRENATGHSRYRMLGSVLEFARELFLTSGKHDAAQERYIAYFRSRLPEKDSRAIESAEALDEIDLSIDDYRALLSWLEENDRTDCLREMVLAMRLWWRERGSVREGWRWLDRVFSDPDQLPPDERYTAEQSLAWFAALAGELESAQRHSQRAMNLAEESQLPAQLVSANTVHGAVNFYLGDGSSAMHFMETALDLAEEHGIEGKQDGLRLNLGTIAHILGDLEGARQHHERGVIETRLEDIRALHEIRLAELAIEENRLQEANAYLVKSWPVISRTQSRLQKIDAAVTKAEILSLSGTPGPAAVLLGYITESIEQSGHALDPTGSSDLLRMTMAIKEQLSPDDFQLEYEQGKQIDSARLEQLVMLPIPQFDHDSEFHGNLFGLTQRESEVLRLVARGLTNPEIGDSLFISDRTVQSHVRNILIKLEVPNRSAAVAVASEHGLLGE